MLLSAVAYGKQMQEAKYMFCGSAFFEGLSGAALHVSQSARIGRAPQVAVGTTSLARMRRWVGGSYTPF